MTLRKHLIPLFLLICISILVHYNWFFNISILAWGDTYTEYPEKILKFFSLPQIWSSEVSFGSINVGLFFWPQIVITTFLIKIGLTPALVERLLFMWPIALLNPIFMYFLCYYILRSRLGAWLGGIAYLFNIPFIIGRSGIITLSIATAIAPLAILFFIISLDKKNLSISIITALICYVISFYEFRIFYMTVWIFGFYAVYHYLIIEKLKNLSSLIKIIGAFLLPIILTFLLNSYSMLGLIGVKSLVSNVIVNRDLVSQSGVNLINSLILNSYLWPRSHFENLWSLLITIKQFIVPIALVFGLIFSKKNKYICFFAFLAILGIFLTKHQTIPFPYVYKWLYINVPGFNAFRESTKFYFYIALSYSLLLGAFASGVIKIVKSRIAKYIGLTFVFLIILSFLWNTKSIITGELGGLYIPRSIPEDYFILKDFIFRQNNFSRTFWTPHPSHWGIYSSVNPKISNWDIVAYDWNKFFSGNVLGVFDKNYSNQLFDVASIKYIIVPTNSPENADDFYNYMGKRSIYLSNVKRAKFLKVINIGTKQLIVFANDNVRPHIYLTDKKETIYKNIPYEKVNFSYLNPTEFRVNLKNIKKPVYLNFSDSFHPEWKLRVGEFDWYQVLTNKNYFLSDKNHFQNNAGLNSFYLDPIAICSSESQITNNESRFTSCSQNPDGSYDINLTLYFRPQSYVYLGGIISLTTLSGILGYLIYYVVKIVRRLYR